MQLSIIAFVSAVFIVLMGPTLIGKWSLNLGFVYLNRSLSDNAQSKNFETIQNSERLFTWAANFAKTELPAKRGLGFAMWQQGEKKNAFRYWKESQIAVESLLLFGDLANTQGKQDEALFWYESAAAVELDRAATPLATHLNQQREFQAAIEIWQEALSTFPKSSQRPDWWLGLSYSLRANQEGQRAADVSRKALEEFPKNPHLLTSFASTLLGLEADYETISSLLQEAILLDDSNAEPYSVMAQLMARENRIEESLSYYNQAIDRDHSVKWWHVARANSARRLGNLEEARAFLLETIGLFPKYAPAYYELAWIYKLSEEPFQAQTAIQQALNLHNSPPVNYYVRAGDIYAWSNEIDLARFAYQRASELAPNDQRVIQGLEALGKSK